MSASAAKTSQIGTPPNILVSEALRDAGRKAFTFFDFTPIGLTIMFAGSAFMTLIGRRLLPRRDVAKEATRNKTIDWENQYDLDEQFFNIRLPAANILVMGPGGYRFMDYFKVGGLLTFLVLIVIVFILPVLWPLTP